MIEKSDQNHKKKILMEYMKIFRRVFMWLLKMIGWIFLGLIILFIMVFRFVAQLADDMDRDMRRRKF